MKHLHQSASVQSLAAAICLSAVAHGSFAQSANASPTEVAQKALTEQMGDAGKDLRVKVAEGNAEISGWAKAPRDVRQAAYIVSTVPGVAHAYSGMAHTWTTSDHL